MADILTLRKFEALSPFEIKDELINLAKKASRTSQSAFLNAGRGNPNWIATTPREAFFLLGQFGLDEARRIRDEPDLAGMPHREGIADRLRTFLEHIADTPGARLLDRAIELGVTELGFTADAFVHELVDGCIGDNYPEPDRMLVHVERVVHRFIEKTMCGGWPPPGRFKLFATEGGTAAMCYVFRSLMENRILRK